MPVSMEIRLSLSSAFADSAIMGTEARAGSGSPRISAVASCPSIMGICMSIKMNEYSLG